MTCNMCGAEGRDPFGECLNCAEPYPYAQPHPNHACDGCGYVTDYCKCADTDTNRS